MERTGRYLWGVPNKLLELLTNWSGWRFRTIRWLVTLVALVVAGWMVVMPLDGIEQLIFGLLVFVFVLYIRSYAGSFITLLLVGVSVLMSTRYLYWRATETLNVTTLLDGVFSIGLLLAEIYAWVVLGLGFLQTIWPLRRRTEPLPADQALWPTVDVLIPTYNEPLEVVKASVLAAQVMDWPVEKLKIYLLDDGHREEFRSFAHEAGVHYIAREDNIYAKAGNINNALKQATGQYVVIFDCDHIPVRSFLTETMGGFLTDPKLALVQTPHHFFSADPFERNLGTFRKIPNEGALFYGLVQDGNDLWNSAYFCGSCAVLKRSALDEIGGIAIDTVTEDAHTSINLHAKGYNSAYLNTPLAGGLATESLSAHIKQRMRWARGMVQIFRIDNPFFKRGLSFMQRLCYANAILHFLYGFPRFFFMTSPLAYLFLEVHVIDAPAGMIAVFALPHLIMSSIANSRMQQQNRHSFWNEVYETTLAWYIMWPTLIALVSPKLGTFNVTAKGGRVEEEYFDWKISIPYVVLFILDLCGLIVGLARMFWWNTYEWDTAAMNVGWAIYNLVMIGATIAVALETKQVRNASRVRAAIPAGVVLSGKTVPCFTQDFSIGGVSVELPEAVQLKKGEPLVLTLDRDGVSHAFPVEVIGVVERSLRLRFTSMPVDVERKLISATFSRANAWENWLEEVDLDHPLHGFRELLRFSELGFERLLSSAHKG